MLGVLSLCDAYYMGFASAEQVEERIARELEREDYQTFLESGVFERYTHILDVTDACLCAADIVKNEELRAKLLCLAEHWKNAYGEDGLMSERSPYYEGALYLLLPHSKEYGAARGKERFATLLDDFFGFGKESIKQLTHRGAAKEIAESKHHRFEGFNNECDMKAPYAYIYADRHGRLCEILHECVHRSFGLGKAGFRATMIRADFPLCLCGMRLAFFPSAEVECFSSAHRK